MAVSRIKVSFESNVQKVWEIVTSLENYGWRSDLSRIEILNEKQFVEYTKAGYPTNFTVTFMEPYTKMCQATSLSAADILRPGTNGTDEEIPELSLFFIHLVQQLDLDVVEPAG